MRRGLFLLFACVCAVPGVAQVSVYSQRADSTSVTIYRGGLALVTETREVELPAEPVTLVFRGVVDSLLPQSAVMDGAERPLAETDYSFDPLTPASLIKRSVGKTVALVRTNRQTGRVTRVIATIVSAGEGVVLQAVDGSGALRCSGVPEHLEFSEVPADLSEKPTLSVKLAGGAPGKRRVTLSYLAHGFSWSSDYVARLNDKADRMSLTGWVTLENNTQSGFTQAQVQVVAGTLNLLSSWERGSGEGPSSTPDFDREVTLLKECYPLGTTTSTLPTGQLSRAEQRLRRTNDVEYYAASPISVLSEVSVTGVRAKRESLGDYQLYRLPWPTDLNARQTKQVVFLGNPRVKVERFYGVRLGYFEAPQPDTRGTPELMLRWKNEKSAGLGEPLPAGHIRVFESYVGSEVFAGEAEILDKPVGLPVEIAIARALNLSSEYTHFNNPKFSDGSRIRVESTHHFVNNKELPVSVEVRHAGDSDMTSPVVIRSSLRAGKKNGELAWRFKVPAGGEQWLRYDLESRRIESQEIEED